jgi:sigma-E factor negative regulatory protein RseB
VRANRIRTSISFIALAVIAPALAADSAYALLQTMNDATRQLNYEGVFVYQRGTQIDSMRLVHKYDGGIEKERLISLSGPAREVIRDGTLVTCLFADDQQAMVEKNPPRDIINIGFSAPVEKLVSSYNFTIEGADRVAGRPVTVVGVTPERDDRYGYKLWIDHDSKLLLKSLILGRGGRTLEQVQFTQISILDEIAPERLRPEIGGSGFTWRTDSDSQNNDAAPYSDSAWRVRWLPSGFELKENNIQNMATSYMPVSYLVFSDGLAMVSVFVEELTDGEPVLQGYSSRGAVNAFSRVADDYQITVVGDVPLPTIKRIATSVAKVDN